MDTQQERLLHLDHALLSGENICSSEGMLRSFPSSFKTPFCINGVGVVVCRQDRADTGHHWQFSGIHVFVFSSCYGTLLCMEHW